MLNPDVLVDAVTAKLRLIPAFVTLMGDATRINSYIDNEAGVVNSLNSMRFPDCIVVWQELEDVAEGQAQWVHRLSIYVRSKERMGLLLYTIVNGVPTGDNRRFSDPDTVDDRWELLGIPIAARDLDEEAIDFLEIRMRYRQKVED